MPLVLVPGSRFATALLAAMLLAGCSTPAPRFSRAQLRQFDQFENFERTTSGRELVLVSPRIEVRPWNELIVSWNAQCPPGTALKIEVRAFDGTNATRYYRLAQWSAEPGPGRTSHRQEADADATLETDTLICRRPRNGAQVRLTLTGARDTWPQLKLLTLSFLNAALPPPASRTNRAAWGMTLDVPRHSQLGWPGARGWCSPTCVSMMLGWWSQQLRRPELGVPVPEVARNVFDTAYDGTGNWSFNMAYAGGFERLRACATRFDGLHEVENCIAAGIPVALSVSFDWLNGRAEDQNDGHLIVVVGFTADGDVVVNDPWPNPKRENSVRKVFPRDRVIRAWQRSKQTAYVIVPAGTRFPVTQRLAP